jgi:hypothetical protein
VLTALLAFFTKGAADAEVGVTRGARRRRGSPGSVAPCSSAPRRCSHSACRRCMHRCRSRRIHAGVRRREPRSLCAPAQSDETALVHVMILIRQRRPARVPVPEQVRVVELTSALESTSGRFNARSIWTHLMVPSVQTTTTSRNQRRISKRLLSWGSLRDETRIGVVCAQHVADQDALTWRSSTQSRALRLKARPPLLCYENTCVGRLLEHQRGLGPRATVRSDNHPVQISELFIFFYHVNFLV